MNPIDEPEPPPPRLTSIATLWRIALTGAFSALACFVPWSFVSYHPRSIVATVVFGAAAWLLVFYRRRRPASIAILICCCAIASPAAIGPGAWALFSLATTRRVRRYVIASALALTATAITLSLPVAHPVIRMLRDNYVVMDLTAVLVSATTVLAWVGGFLTLAGALGWQVGAQRNLLWRLQDRTRRAEAERDLRIAQARSLERERIAREMHDGLAHRISQISVHAGALTFRPDLDSDQIGAAATTIQQSSHQALTELRGVLGVLRDTDDADGSRPIASATDLGELLDSHYATGMQLRVQIETDVLDDLAPPIGRAVYRILQEALTNAGRHAFGQPVTVRITRAADALEITVHNRIAVRPGSTRPGAPLPESGYGIVGLTERVALLDGTLDIDRSSTDFTLRARLPLSTRPTTDAPAPPTETTS